MPATQLVKTSMVNIDLVRAHSIAALVALLISVSFGIIVALQFVYPDLTEGSLTLGWGRLRYAHTQGIMLGWLGNAFIAFLYHAVPVLTERPVTSKRLGWLIFGLWNFVALIPGWILVLNGISQPLEWAEFPLIIDIFVIVAFILAAVQFLPPFFRHGLDSLYVSSWYIIGGLVFTILAYPMGNFVPEMVSGATSAAFGGLWIHDAVGLFVTPLALAIIYFVIPASSGRPVFSHFLSMLGFWGLFFFYPLNGTHHYIFSVIPMEAQMGAIAASALLGVVVLIVVTNLMLSLRGSGFKIKDPALRFVAAAVVFYFLVSMQGASQAQMKLNQFVHFSDWIIGHSHLAMLGFATFASIGGIVHIWQRIPDAKYNARAVDLSFNLLFAGISIMVIDLTIAGIIQGQLWQEAAPWLESVQASKPYWVVRNFSSIPIAAGFISLAYGLFSGPRGAWIASLQKQEAAITSTNQPAPTLALETEARPSRGLSMSYLVASVAGIGFFALSMVLLGLWPAKVLDEQIALTSPEYVLQLSASEERGRQIYAREGCAYCHTQQIRYLESDIQRFGAPTLAWETQFDSPHLWGTRRIGPDLSREGSSRTADWQYAHLYSPRSVVPLSIMPSYSALFNGAATQPKQEARDLVAYLDSLGRARSIAWPESDESAKLATADDKWAQMSFDTPQLNAHPANAQTGDNAPPQEVLTLRKNVTSTDQGLKLWMDNCSGCHGDQALGDGPAATWLTPQPANLQEHQYSPVYLADILWNGIEGTSMPAWRDQSPENLAALITLVMQFSTETNDLEASNETLALGEKVYAQHCTQCHGINGESNGFAVDRLSIKPTDFTGKRPSIGRALNALTNGIDGTPMAPWTDRLSNDEMLAVSMYVRSFFEQEQSREVALND